MMLPRFLPLAAALAAALVLAGCGDGARPTGKQPIFGNGTVDNSRVLAKVNGEPITERMLELRFEELAPREQNRFQGEEGRRLFLRQMVDEVLRTRTAEERRLELDPEVARVLISQRRAALDQALRNLLVKDRQPTIDEIRAYFAANQSRYVRLGTMNAAHVECRTKEDADRAYRLASEPGRPFATAVKDYSVNTTTKINAGDLGWFNRGGFIPGILNSKGFTERIWDFAEGVNPPFEFEDSWHVVRINERRYERPQTLEEAYDRVVSDLMPDFQKTVVDDWMRQSRQDADLEYFGEFRPGHGKTDRELLERAFNVKDPQQKLDLLGLLVDDYPESEFADDALFTAGNVALDTWGDRRQAGFFFLELIKRYPTSDYATDSQYILDHMDEPNFVAPRSIEELRGR
ncbi:MAG TPA: peptidyl-prolyl cis-trans isomerase [Candidatus Krumholzibacteria bacterium]|nr:peptidyl-prolyl cis-trans isomerase [Candidatus Krumholzibacteria bacterium]HPD72746.1 peptidyl-prolyl cis-trans isomerase [Candidatus Krumholzibacteria bacterium]HRY40322.1 peptidyl-prolyl cis-trans isomerase [Candidatus Krumholzibacteria bacterium]